MSSVCNHAEMSKLLATLLQDEASVSEENLPRDTQVTV